MKFLKQSFAVVILVVMLMAFTALTKEPKPDTKETQFAPVAVIELFTSQGCSSCPSAERLLTRTSAEAQKTGQRVVALSFHVDYWNRLGWKDPFSDKKFSERQQEYAQQFGLNSVYTPQAIVNGQWEMTGSDEQKLRAAIRTSLTENAPVQFKGIMVTSGSDHRPMVSYSLEGDYAGCNINVALVSINEITAVKRGENSGATLMNGNVVRQFISSPAMANGSFAFNVSPMPADHNRAVVAYIQRRSSGKIIGAVMSNDF